MSTKTAGGVAAALCCHCQRRKPNRPLGLCGSCFHKPGVRENYLPARRTVATVSQDRAEKPPLPFVVGGLTQQEVAELLGVSRGRIHQIETAALRKLARHPDIRRLAEECGILSD